MPFVDDRLGEKWYWLFLVYFPDLPLRQVQLLSKFCAGVSHQAINDWFWELYEYLFKTGNIDILDLPNQMYNCDKTSSPWPHTQQMSSHQKVTPTCTSRGHDKGTNYHATHGQCHCTLHPPTCHVSWAKFPNVFFPRCSVWTFSLRLDGPGPVLLLVRAELHPQN